MLDGIVEVLRELDFSPKLLNPWNPESVLKSLNPESWERERGLRYIYILHQGLVFAIMLLDLWSWVCSTRLVSGEKVYQLAGLGVATPTMIWFCWLLSFLVNEGELFFSHLRFDVQLFLFFAQYCLFFDMHIFHQDYHLLLLWSCRSSY